MPKYSEVELLARDIVNNTLAVEQFKELNKLDKDARNQIIVEIDRITNNDTDIGSKNVLKNLLEYEIKNNNKNFLRAGSANFLSQYIKYLMDIKSLYEKLKNEFRKMKKQVNQNTDFTNLFLNYLKISKEHADILKLVISVVEKYGISKDIIYKNLLLSTYQPLMSDIITEVFKKNKYEKVKYAFINQVSHLDTGDKAISFLDTIIKFHPIRKKSSSCSNLNSFNDIYRHPIEFSVQDEYNVAL